MADAATRVSIFFQSEGGTAPAGWTENYWSFNADLSTLLDTIKTKYVPKRAALLGVGCFIKYIRVTNVPPNRVSKVYYLVGKEGEASLFTTSPADDFDPVQVALLCRATTADGKRRQLWVDGLPDSQTDQLLKQGITGAFTGSPAWKQFVAGIIASQLLLRNKLTNGPPPTYSAAPITDVQPIMVRNRKRGRPFGLFRGRRIA